MFSQVSNQQPEVNLLDQLFLLENGWKNTYTGFVLPLPECMMYAPMDQMFGNQGVFNFNAPVMNSDPEHKSLEISKHGFERKADELLMLVQNTHVLDGDYIINGNPKANAKKGASKIKTRSKYIGVTKNGNRWQAMVTVKKKRIYINSYQNEEEAARAFDFFCILLHKLDAKTNFSYTKSEVMDMILLYQSKGYVW